jgi:hypothetical protein
VAVSDQEQTQVTAGAFMEDPRGLRLTSVLVFDFFHRYVRCLKAAEAGAGLTPLFWAAVTIYNIGYGPWDSCLWWAQILDEARMFAQVQEASSPLLMAFWRGILIDKNLDASTCENDVGRPARERFLHSLTGSNTQLEGISEHVDELYEGP